MSIPVLARIGYFNIIIGALSTLTIFMMRISFKVNLPILIFIAWLLAPYFIMGWFLKTRLKGKNQILSDCIASFFSVAFSLYALIDINYIHPDPQGAIAMLIVPVLQVGIFIFLNLLLSRFVEKERPS